MGACQHSYILKSLYNKVKWRNSMTKKIQPKFIGIIVFLLLLTSGCGLGQDNINLQSTSIAQEIYSTQTAEAKQINTQINNPTSTPESNILFSDDFSASSSRHNYSDGDVEVFQDYGVLSILITKPNWMFATFHGGSEYNDLTIDVDVKTIEGDGDDSFGVTCRASDDDVYMFQISVDGFFSVLLWEENIGYTPLHEWTRSSAINVGRNVENHLTIICNGNNLSFSVNDVLLTQITDNNLVNGNVELYASNNSFSNVKVEFDNLIVTKPSASISLPTTPQTGSAGSCQSPSSITKEHDGRLVEVCGKVTNWGDVACPDCPNGGYSYLNLDDSFLILSYDWVFNNEWVGSCVRVSDTIEMLGNDPVIVFGSGEGYAGSDCTKGSDGALTCDKGDYFIFYTGCE